MRQWDMFKLISLRTEIKTFVSICTVPNAQIKTTLCLPVKDEW